MLLSIQKSVERWFAPPQHGPRLASRGARLDAYIERLRADPDRAAALLELPAAVVAAAALAPACAAFRSVGECHLPTDQSEALGTACRALVPLHAELSAAEHRVAVVPPQGLEMEADEDEGAAAAKRPVLVPRQRAAARHMTAEDFLPLLTFVAVMGAPKQLLLQVAIVTSLVDPDEAIGEHGYYLASFEAAVHHLNSLRRGERAEEVERVWRNVV